MKKFSSLFVVFIVCFFTLSVSAQPVPKLSLWKSIKQAITYPSKKAAATTAYEVGSHAAKNAALSAMLEKKVPAAKKPLILLPSPTVLSSATKVSQVSDEDYLHAVWKVEFVPGQTAAYLKLGTEEELARTKEFDAIVKKLSPRFDLIDIEYPHVLAEGYGGLPAALEEQVKHDLSTRRFFRLKIRDIEKRAQLPFVLSKIDTRGLTFAMEHNYLSAEEVQSFFREKPITLAEWAQIEGFVKSYIDENFNHGDLTRNFYLKRGTDGRVKLSILDFEVVEEPFGDLVMLNVWQEALRQDGCLAF